MISEINYNPDGPDDYEFIEIWNAGTNLVDLSGVEVSNAVRFIFSDNLTLYPDNILRLTSRSPNIETQDVVYSV